MSFETKNKQNHSTTSEQIPSPYNFVPLSNSVFFPDWSDQVSHDIPFSDGISGELEIEAIAKTPIYIRNGGNWNEDDKITKNSSRQEFFRLSPEGKYMIPGSSFKGMLRNVIEIASFGKMQQVDDTRYSIRDLRFDAYRNKLTKENRYKQYSSKVKSGWLESCKGDWNIIPCQYARIEQEELEKYYRQEKRRPIQIGQSKECSSNKYNKWNLALDLFCNIDIEKSHKHSCGQLLYRKATVSGQQKGTIVFTGQPSSRRNKNAKHMEFIFFESEESSLKKVNSLKDDFEFIHSDDKDNPNEEWKYWKAKMQQGERVPVFYLENEKGKISSMGLAMMYRLAYNLTIHNSIKDNFCNKNNENMHLSIVKPDLAETIFGFVNQKYNPKALKGRVQVGHLFAQKIPENQESVKKTILGSPKPTYYPNYIEQKTNDNGIVLGEYKTLLDSDAKIRGWKRYPIREDNFATNTPILKREQEKVSTIFKPLPSETTFSGTIRFHNLRPQELGAIIWALTWGGKENLRHSVGMAKPYGYGSLQVKITSQAKFPTNNNKKNYSIEDLLKAFENLMEQEREWTESEEEPQIYHLMEMANPKAKPPMKLEYPVLDPDERKNDFTDFKNERKKGKKALLPYISKKQISEEIEKSKKEKQEAQKITEQKRKDSLSPEEKAREELKQIRIPIEKELWSDISRRLPNMKEKGNNSEKDRALFLLYFGNTSDKVSQKKLKSLNKDRKRKKLSKTGEIFFELFPEFIQED